MDTRSKSKRRYLGLALFAFVLATTIMALTAVDVYVNRHYLDKDYYLNTYEHTIANELAALVRLIKEVHVDAASQDGKTNAQKADPAQLQKLVQQREQKLAQAEADIAAEFDPNIEAARRGGNKTLETQLAAEKANKLAEVQNKIRSEWSAKLEELASSADKRYEARKYSLLLREGTFKYYIQDNRNNKVYTNLEKEPSELEVRESALITVQIPPGSGERSWGLTRFFQDHQWEGLIYVPRDAEPDTPPALLEGNTAADPAAAAYTEEEGYYRDIISDATYYQSERWRLLNEIVLLVVCLLAAAALAWYLKQQKAIEQPIVAGSLALFRRIPLDIRLLLLLPAGLFYLAIAVSVEFFSFRMRLEQIVMPFLLSPLTALFLLYLVEAWLMYKNPATIIQQWQKSFTVKLFTLLKESFIQRGVFFKLILLFGLSVGMCLSLLLGMVALANGGRDAEVFLLLSFLYALFYVSVVLPYILRRIGLLNRIMLGVAQMAAGDFDTVIEVGKTRGKLADTARSLNSLKHGVKRSLEDRMKSERLKSELITNVSHDLKTPLTSIINYVDLLKREDLSAEERQRYVQILERKTERLKVLIDDLFEASKMASGSVELNIEQVNVAALLNQAIAEFSEKIEQSSLTFRVKIENHKIYAPLDGKKTWRVFENLISNALKYALPGTRVHVHLTETDDTVQFTIKNVSSYEIDFDAEELFERFKRADPSRNTEGSGLGLAIAKSIVELQGGNMSLAIDGDYFKVMVEFRK